MPGKVCKLINCIIVYVLKVQVYLHICDPHYNMLRTFDCYASASWSYCHHLSQVLIECTITNTKSILECTLTSVQRILVGILCE